jgi:hypothetical protein
MEAQAAATGSARASNVPLLDLLVGGGIIEAAFPQHPAEIPRFLAIEEIPHSKRDGRAVFLEAGDLLQFFERFIVYFNRHSHVTKMILFTSFVNH